MVHRFSIVLVLCLCGAVVRADQLVLANGDRLNGEIVERALEYVVIAHPQLGRLRLSLDQLAIDAAKPPNPGLLGTGFLRGWKRSVDVGLNGEQGTTETTNLTAGLHLDYEDQFKRWRLRGRYFLDRDDDGTSDNNSRLDLVRDWLVPSNRWFFRGEVSHQFDEFESWEHRITAAAGPGYHLVKRENYSIDTVLSAAFTREFGDRGDNKGEGLLGLDYSWKVNDTLSLHFSNRLFVETTPSPGEYRNLSIGEWKLLLAEQPGLNLRIGLENEYETSVEGDDKRNNLKYYMTLGLDF